jgi:hypothetical protein
MVVLVAVASMAAVGVLVSAASGRQVARQRSHLLVVAAVVLALLDLTLARLLVVPVVLVGHQRLPARLLLTLVAVAVLVLAVLALVVLAVAVRVRAILLVLVLLARLTRVAAVAALMERTLLALTVVLVLSLFARSSPVAQRV